MKWTIENNGTVTRVFHDGVEIKQISTLNFKQVAQSLPQVKITFNTIAFDNAVMTVCQRN